MHAFAQTNLQLFNQMRAQGYAADDIVCLARGYELATSLFSGRFRANGKSFLAHLIGTASILVAQSMPIDVITAGLLHAAYLQGDFGFDRPMFSSSVSHPARDKVTNVIGIQAESYLFRYTRLTTQYRQCPEQVLQMGACASLQETDKQALVLLIANELEEYLDLAMLYCSKLSDVQQDIESRIPALVHLAQQLNLETLAADLLSTSHSSMGIDIESRLRTLHQRSYLVLSPSYRQKLSVSIRHFLAVLTQALRGRLKQTLKFAP